jgi:perosamine synthetase
MLDAGVATRRGVMCAHREIAYGRENWSCGFGSECNCTPGTCIRLNESEEAQDHTIVLPLFHQMTDADQDRVVAVLHDACKDRACG